MSEISNETKDKTKADKDCLMHMFKCEWQREKLRGVREKITNRQF